MKGKRGYKPLVKRGFSRNVLVELVISRRLFFHGKIIYNILELDGWIATRCSGQKASTHPRRLVGKEVTFQQFAPNKKRAIREWVLQTVADPKGEGSAPTCG